MEQQSYCQVKDNLADPAYRLGIAPTKARLIFTAVSEPVEHGAVTSDVRRKGVLGYSTF